MTKRQHMTFNDQMPRRITDDDQRWGKTKAPANTLLVNAYTMLTEQGEVVAAWMDASGIAVPDIPAPKDCLLKPVARWFATLSPEDAGGLLAQAQAKQDAPVISKGHG